MIKIPFVKEWGSWVVFIVSISAGLITGAMAYTLQDERDFAVKLLLTVLGLTILINSKNPLVSTIRTKGRERGQLLWFLIFFLAGAALLIPFLFEGFESFYIFSILVISYIILLSAGKEHSLISELNGFALLTLSSAVVYFVITGEVAIRLYLAVFAFFAAGVFKVKVRLKKTAFYRWIMIIYCAGISALFYVLQISLFILLPFIENILSAMIMREEKLKTTGYTELIKGILFLILIGIFWK